MEKEIKPGTQVELFEDKKLLCAVCLEVKNGRLLVLTEQNREANIAAKRILRVGDTPLDINQSKVQLIAALQETATQRQDLASHVSVEELWELLHVEEEGFDCQELAEICFSEEVTANHASAVFRALLSESFHFKYKRGLFYANSPERLEQMRRQLERQAQRERRLVEGSAWLAAVWRGEKAPEPADRSLYVRMLSDFCLFNTEAADYQDTKKILGLAQVPIPQGVFQLLVKLGEWKEDENLHLHRLGIQQEFSLEVLNDATQIEESSKGFHEEKDNTAREDFTSLPTMTIDGPLTRDYDDALSVRSLAPDVEVGIHIADAAEFVLPGSTLDKEALERTTSLYLPDAKIPMLPPLLSEGICSLKQGEPRLALSLLVRFDENDQMQDHRFVVSRIQVQRQITYTEANELVATDDTLSYLYRLSTRLRRQRVADGALPLPLPELRVWINSNNDIHISKTEHETPSQLVVSELMILANSLAAKELAVKGFLAIYRSQEEPQQIVVGEGSDDLYLNYRQRRYLSRAELGIIPKPHSGLGTTAYTSWTSPIRRYLDLVVQRQLKSMVLGRAPGYAEGELREIIARIGLGQGRALQIKRDWTKYWVLKYLEKERIKLLDALVLAQGKRTYHLLLPEYLLEASMPLEDGKGLSPGDHFRVQVALVNAREEVLKLRMV